MTTSCRCGGSGGCARPAPPVDAELRAAAERVAAATPAAPLAHRYRALCLGEAELGVLRAEAEAVLAELGEIALEVRSCLEDVASALARAPGEDPGPSNREPVALERSRSAAEPADRLNVLRARLEAVVADARRERAATRALRPLPGSPAPGGALRASPGAAARAAAMLLEEPMLRNAPLGMGLGASNAWGAAQAMIAHVERHRPAPSVLRGGVEGGGAQGTPASGAEGGGAPTPAGCVPGRSAGPLAGASTGQNTSHKEPG